MSVRELKQHLTERGIDFCHVKEKAELQSLALDSGSDSGKAVFSSVCVDPGEHLLEC